MLVSFATVPRSHAVGESLHPMTPDFVSAAEVSPVLCKHWSAGPKSPKECARDSGPGWGLRSGQVFFVQAPLSACLSVLLVFRTTLECIKNGYTSRT